MRISTVDVRLWSTLPAGPAWRVESAGLSLVVTRLGAHLCQVSIPDGGERVAISRDYPPDSTPPGGFHGATVGRYANRIAGARFEIDGVEHQLVPNEAGNQLHGGPQGFSAADWDGSAETVGGVARIELHHLSPAGDQGFPGDLAAVTVFEIAEDRIIIRYSATTNVATPVNLTNHTYWNLGGERSDLGGHSLTVASDRVVLVGDDSIPVAGPPASVAGTRFDCRADRCLSEIIFAGGYDHCFVSPPMVADGPLVRLAHESGRSLELKTDQPGVQIYTAAHLSPPSTAVALESQYLPNTPNRPDFGNCTLRVGQQYRARTEIGFGW